MKPLSFVLYEVKDGVAIITINRPEVRNATHAECWEEVNLCLETAENDPNVFVLILTGAGEKAFISGADIRTLRERTPLYQFHHPWSLDSLQRIENLSKPVIAAVNGTAFGAGFETALACDIRIASTNAKFGLPETNLGILPGGGGTQRLSRIVGVGQAKEVIMAGKVYTAQDALAAGLVMKVTEPEHLMDEAFETAKVMMKKGPVALAIVKQVLNHSLDTDRATGFLAEQLGFMALLGTEDKIEGTTAFLEKRPAKFSGK